VTANNRSFDSQNIDTGGQSWTYTAASKGTFPYFCIYHPLMHGTIVVQS
jgi:plastocyanin